MKKCMNNILRISFYFIAIVMLSHLVSCNYDDGKSAYELYCEQNPGYTGSLDEWLDSLAGENGKSVYELYCEQNPGYTGSLREWLDSLVGNNGKSAYELYCEQNPEYTGTLDEWLNALVNGTLQEIKKHTVTFDIADGSPTFTQTVVHGEKAITPTEPTRLGYKFLGWYYDGADDEKWSFIGYSVTEDIKLIARWDYSTYEIPIVNINTNGVAINSNEDYTDMVFNLENCDGELSEISGGIRLRGNSTRHFPKKPYRIKFDKKQSLFGLEKAKSWVLLAEYIDPSALHNYTALTLGGEMPGLAFTPTPHKVNVYLNGNYAGLYTLCEQVQENEGRMNIELEEITENMVDLKDFNFFISMDIGAKSDPTLVEGESYFYIEEYDKYFELKYPEKSQFASEAQFESFFNQLKTYIKEVMDAFNEKDIDKIKAEVNINSLVDYLIIDQIMGEHDHFWKSFNLYYTNTSDNADENDKLNFGPIWDYDWSLHTPYTGEPNQYYKVSDTMYYSNLFFVAVSEIPEFYELVKERYELYAKNALVEYIDELDNLVKSIENSIKLNHELWYAEIGDDLSEKNIEFLKAFLENRKRILDAAWCE